MNFKTITIILGVVVASIILGSKISEDPFGQVTASETISATREADEELKRDASDEPGWECSNYRHSFFDRIVDTALDYQPGRPLGLR